MADKNDAVLKKLRSIDKRLSALESAGGNHHTPISDHHHSASEYGVGACSLPDVPERQLDSDVSKFRARLIRYIEKKWLNGTTLNYYLFQTGPFAGPPSNQELVRSGFQAWEDIGLGVNFVEVDDINDSHIRVGFLRGDGAWSYVGRDVIDIPGRHERTMNFGWDLTLDPRGGGLDTPIHEIGHTLGFPHEHQNPFSGIVWDEEAVYREYAQPPNSWSRDETYHNILRKLSPQSVEGSEWDPDSIMHYGFGPGLILEPAEYRNGIRPTDGLTEADIAEAKKFYPVDDMRKYRKLTELEVERLDIEPGEQVNFIIEPDRTDDYTIATLGDSDTLMVLFEEINGNMEVVAGDDDSGTGSNAQLSVRLFKSRQYVLRVRLYLNWASGTSAVMLS